MRRLLSLLIALALLTASPPTLLAQRPGPGQQTDQKKDVTVYITRTGKRYHRASCSSLRSSSIPISLKDAKAKGYTACKICKPPQ